MPNPFADRDIPESAILPSQFFHSGHLRPEHLLFAAILEGAKADYYSLDPTTSLEAEEWFQSDDDSWFCSFVNICEVFKINPDSVRKNLFNRTLARRKRLRSSTDTKVIDTEASKLYCRVYNKRRTIV